MNRFSRLDKEICGCLKCDHYSDPIRVCFNKECLCCIDWSEEGWHTENVGGLTV